MKKKPKAKPVPKAKRPPVIVWNGNTDLRPLLAPIDSLRPDPRNARKHPANQLARLTANLKRFGQQKPVVVSVDGTIVAGNATFVCAIRLGWTHVARSTSDLAGAELTAFGLADNIAADLAQWDRELFDELIGELEAADVDLGEAGLDLSEDELTDIMAEADEQIARSERGHADSDPPAVSPEQDAEPEGEAESQETPDRPAGPPKERFGVVVWLNDEPAQAAFLEEMQQRGLNHRSL